MKRALFSILAVIPFLLLVLVFHHLPDVDAPANSMEKALDFFVNGEQHNAEPYFHRTRFEGWGPYQTAIVGIHRCWVLWGDTGGIYLRFDYEAAQDDWNLVVIGKWQEKEDPYALRDLILLLLEATEPRPFVPEGVI